MSYIVVSPHILHGKPRIKGTRITVSMVLELLANGISPREICGRWYPDLTLADVHACIAFANRFLSGEELHVTREPRRSVRTQSLVSLLVDHCVWRPTVDALRHAGIRCVTLRELGRAEARNGEVLALAAKRRSVLLTRDADFTDLVQYPAGRHRGIIYLRITPRTMGEVHHVLLTVLRRTSPVRLRGALVIVGPTAYRLRRPSK